MSPTRLKAYIVVGSYRRGLGSGVTPGMQIRKDYLGGVLGNLVGTCGAILVNGLLEPPFWLAVLIGLILGALGLWIGFATNRRD